MEEFTKLTLHKFRNKMPNLGKSNAVNQKMSRHKVVFGGAIATGIDKQKRDNKLANYRKMLHKRMSIHYEHENKAVQYQLQSKKKRKAHQLGRD